MNKQLLGRRAEDSMACRRNNPMGFTLVELLVVISVGSGLMLLAIGVVQQSMTFAQLGYHRADQDRTMVRLDRQFRQDVHRCEGFELQADNQLQMSLDAETEVVYTIESSRIERRLKVAGEMRQHETYDLNLRTAAELQRFDTPSRLGIVLTTDTQLQTESLRTDRQIIAAVGLRRKLLPETQTAPAAAAESNEEDGQ